MKSRGLFSWIVAAVVALSAGVSAVNLPIADAAWVARDRVLLGAPSWVLPQRPSVDCQFTANRCWNGATVVAPSTLLTTTRASSGFGLTSAGTLVNFASNIPRITDLGLLVEESRTNLAKQSGDFTLSGGNPWFNGNLIGTPSATTPAPSGWGNLFLIVPSAANTTHSFYQGPFTAAAGTYTVSILAKAGGYNWLGLSFGSSAQSDGAFFNLATGVIGTKAGGVTATMTQLGSTGVYRCTISVAVALNSGYIQIEPHTADNQSSYAGDGVSGIYAGAGQFELGAFATSYIPTTTVAVTRAADAITGTGRLQSVYAGTAASFLASVAGETQTGVNPRIIGSTNSPVTVMFHGGAPGGTFGSYNGTTLVNTANVWTFQGANKGAIAYNSVGRSVVLNNGLVNNDLNAAGTLGTMQLGSDAGANQFMDGYIRRLSGWDSRLPDPTLKTLTGP